MFWRMDLGYFGRGLLGSWHRLLGSLDCAAAELADLRAAGVVGLS
jgi:hypothetical protein